MNSLNSGGRARSGIRVELLVVLVLETALVAALHWSAGPTYAIPLQSLGDWLRTSDPTVSLVAVARILALAIGYWLLVTTVLYAMAHYLGWQSMTEALRWITLPLVRRIVQGVTAMSLTGVSLMGPAAVSVGPALAQDVIVAQADDGSSTSIGDGTDQIEDGTEETPAPSGYAPDAAGWPEPGVDSDFWRPEAVVTQTQSATSHDVAAGDHLWSIAEDHLRSATGRDVTEDEICQYWVRVVDANRDGLRSGDPDMIYPEEVITLPSVFSE